MCRVAGGGQYGRQNTPHERESIRSKKGNVETLFFSILRPYSYLLNNCSHYYSRTVFHSHIRGRHAMCDSMEEACYTQILLKKREGKKSNRF